MRGMLRKQCASCFSLLMQTALVGALWAVPLEARVTFVHDIHSRELFLGEQHEEEWTSYTSGEMYTDRNKRYSGKWMRKLFGKEKEHRQTTHVCLEQGEIRQVDYERNRIVLYPLERIADVEWVEQKLGRDEQTQAMIQERYQVLEPQLQVLPLGERETLGGHWCRLVESTLRQETVDHRKDARSVTLIRQKLWLADNIPGHETRLQFHERLASALGFESERLGNLSFLLRHWKGPLDPIRHMLAHVQGFPVKSEITVEARYTTGAGSQNPRTITRVIKEETRVLREIHEGEFQGGSFELPSHFRVVVAR